MKAAIIFALFVVLVSGCTGTTDPGEPKVPVEAPPQEEDPQGEIIEDDGDLGLDSLFEENSDVGAPPLPG